MKNITVLLLALALSTMGLAYDSIGFMTGENTGDQFGSAVCTMDFNGDGFPDLIVSAPAYNEGSGASGKVYIYFGGPSADTIADMTITGSSNSSFFGKSLACAGDYNNDSYDDLLVGAPFYDLPAENAGAVYLYYGGPSADTIADYFMVGEAKNDYFGISVCGIGDFNNDGIDDFAVGAYQADFASFTNSGKVYVYYGGSTMATAADKVLIGEVDGERFGYAITAGDYNGDNISDIAVGAYSYDNEYLNAGRVYVFHGSSSPDGISDLIINGHATGALYGRNLTSGKYDADSYDDIIMGSEGYAVDTGSTGRVYVFSGGPSMDTLYDYTYSLNRVADDDLGQAVLSGFDISGDGYDDILTGMPGNDDAQVDAGGVIVLTGPSAMTPDTVIYGLALGEEMGYAVGVWPHYISNDDYAIAGCAPSYDSFRGRVHLYRQTVSAANHPPVLEPIGNKYTAPNELLSFSVSATDPDGTIPDLSTSTLPTGASFVDNNDGTGQFSWTPTENSVTTITFYADDGTDLDSEVVQITVTDSGPVCGDANSDGQVNVGDAVFLINYIFKSGSAPNPVCSGDSNHDGNTNVGDAVYLINYAFKGGPAPVENCCQ